MDIAPQQELDELDSHTLLLPTSAIPTAIPRNIIEKYKPPQLSDGMGDVPVASSDVAGTESIVSMATGENSSTGRMY